MRKLSTELEVLTYTNLLPQQIQYFAEGICELENTIDDLLKYLDCYKLEVETLKQQLPSTHRCFITNQGMELLTRKLEEYNE